MLADKHEVLISRVSDLKQEIQNTQLTPAQKEAMLSTLRDAHSKNEETLNDIRSKPHLDDEISQLKEKVRKVATKNSQI